MKKLVYLLIGIVFPLTTSAQLQNLDFEQWDNPITNNGFDNKPTNWICSNRWYGTEMALFSPTFYYAPETNAENNNYALKMSVWYNYMKDVAVQTSPINRRPVALRGHYKYEENVLTIPETLIDTAQVVVWLTKWNAAVAKHDTIGMGIFKTYEATSEYKEFGATIEYFSEQVPDSIIVLLDPSVVGRYLDMPIQQVGLNTSFFTVDNLVLVDNVLAANNNNPAPAFSIYPNPVKDNLHFEGIKGDLKVFDLTGKQIKQYPSNTNSIDVSNLNKGFYILQIENEKGKFVRKFIKS